MDTQKFDDLIKSKMDALKVPENKEAWATFTEKEPAMQANTEAFDHLIRSKIHRIHPVFKERHWAAMELRLQLIKTRIQTILLSKVMEGLGVLLIVLTYSLGHKAHVDPVQQVPKTCPVIEIQTPGLKPKSKGPIAHSLKSDPKNHLSAIDTHLAGLDTQKPALVAEAGYDNLHNQNADAQKVYVEPISSVIASIYAVNETAVKGTGETEGNPLEVDNSGESEMMWITSPLSSAAGNTPESEMAFSMGHRLITPVHFPSTRYYLGGYATADVNLINTPFDKLYSISSYKKEAINHSFGLSFSGKKGQLEWETGLEFVQRKYKPATITETFGQGPDYYFETSLKEIRYTIAGIPFHLKYHFAEQQTWSAYMVTTLQTNLIMDAGYMIEEELKHGRPMPSRYTPEAPRLEEKPFIKGLLHGESLTKNYYIHAGIGLGMQKSLFQHTSMYMQTSYFRHIISNDIGIGPNKDKIHGTSFQLGIKTLLR